MEHIGIISASHNADTLYFNDQYSLQITQNCLGIKLMYIYAMLIIAYPGALIKNKVWFIAMGMVILHLLNITRMIVLSFVIVNSGNFEFVHGFIFKLLFYGTTFVLWFIWIRNYVDPNKFDNEQQLKVKNTDSKEINE